MRRPAAALPALLATRPAACAAWEPAPSPMMTRWAADVAPDQAPEYPRPMLVRGAATWAHLNGLWQVDPNATDLADPPFGRNLSGEILVPYPLESPLSGLRVQPPHGYMWYRRTFGAVACAGGATLLHFEAVDHDATVWVNGEEVGRHVGGYDEFGFDVTAALGARPGGPHELVVGVHDATDGVKGKQCNTALAKTGGTGNCNMIMYTSTSGIWATVWQECAPAPARVDAVIPTALPDLTGFSVEVPVAGAAGGLTVDVAVLGAAGRVVANATGPAGRAVRVALPPAARRLWSPASPYLHDLSVTLRRGAAAVDAVRSYAGLRTYTVAEVGGVPRPLLNGEFVMQSATLDQGFWPDGNYAAPTDAALRSDLEAHKSMGFNAVRKHQKVEPRRWYYHADVLGLLVWQDMPCCADSTFPDQLRNVVEKRRMYTSIVQWDTFNEGGGMKSKEFVGEMVDLVRATDPSRPVDSASGGKDLCGHLPWQGGCLFGNFTDVHHYPEPELPDHPRQGTARVLGEYGGLLLKPGQMDPPRSEWATGGYTGGCIGHGSSSSQANLTGQFVEWGRALARLRDGGGLSAAVYTQLSDVEAECNGMLTYDRVWKADAAAVRAANDALTGAGAPAPPAREARLRMGAA